MKRTTNLMMACLCLGLLFSSCSKEEEVSPISKEAEEEAQLQNASEEQAIPIATLSQGIVITGAEKESGTPPTPTGKLDFTLSSDQQEAFQRTGFTIEFSTDMPVTGAYIRFLDTEDNAANHYFDASLSADQGSRFAPSRNSVKKSTLSHARTMQDNQEISVSFDESVPAGRFCYEICVYDDQGNISAPQKVCVEVEAWGGNASIVGEWIFDRSEPADDNNEKDTLQCENGQEIITDYYKEYENEWTFVLNGDGSYYEIYNETEESLDYEASRSSCSAVYEESETDSDKYSGNWSYNEQAQTLTVVDFKYENLLDAADNEEYEEGDVYFEGVAAEVIAGELVLTETSTEDGSTVVEKAIFRRK